MSWCFVLDLYVLNNTYYFEKITTISFLFTMSKWCAFSNGMEKAFKLSYCGLPPGAKKLVSGLCTTFINEFKLVYFSSFKSN